MFSVMPFIIARISVVEVCSLYRSFLVPGWYHALDSDFFLLSGHCGFYTSVVTEEYSGVQ